MKTAKLPDGSAIVASQDSPKEAKCPFCGGMVLIRRRKLMNDRGYAYYWRHRDNEHRDCLGRSRQA